ncbi:long chronological lifespan protein 2 [Cryptococcus sp. DSM 104548]
MYYPLAALLLLPLTLAQFGNFFQGHFGGHQHQQEQPGGQSPGRQHKGWTENDRLSCTAGYVCPASLACVATPADCPCPYPEDIKCVIPDHRERDEGEGPPFVCVRDNEGCAQVVKFSKPI